MKVLQQYKRLCIKSAVIEFFDQKDVDSVVDMFFLSKKDLERMIEAQRAKLDIALGANIERLGSALKKEKSNLEVIRKCL